MTFETFDASHLIASSPIAAVIYYVAVRVLKPLISNYLTSMVEAISENTKALNNLTEAENRASGYNREEHSKIVTNLEVLTNTLLTANGHPPTESMPLSREEQVDKRLDEIEKFLQEK